MSPNIADLPDDHFWCAGVVISPPFTIYLTLPDADLTTPAENSALIKSMQENVAIDRAKEPEI